MKKGLIVAIVLVLLGLGFAYNQFNKPHRDIASEKADFSISANDLFDAFDENEKKANDLYLDKVITVNGPIVNLETNQDGMGVVTLQAENAMIGGVLCTLKENYTNLVIEQIVSLKCKCTGFLDDVVLIDCSLKK